MKLLLASVAALGLVGAGTVAAKWPDTAVEPPAYDGMVIGPGESRIITLDGSQYETFILDEEGVEVTKVEREPVPLFIDCQDEYKLGEKIRIRVGGDKPEEMELTPTWEWPEEFETEKRGEYVYIWVTKPGPYTPRMTPQFTAETLKAGPNWPDDPKDMKKVTLRFTGQRLSRTFKVVAPGVPDVPDNPDPPPPDAPLSALAKLVPNPETRRALFEFFGDLAEEVRKQMSSTITVQHFIAAYRKSIVDAKAQGLLPSDGSVTPIDRPVSDRIKATLGELTPEHVLDPSQKAALAALFQSISQEFAR